MAKEEDADHGRGPPSQTLAQRLLALKKANLIRSQRAELKRNVRHGNVRLSALLIDPPDCVLNAPLRDLLLSVPGLGEVRASRLLTGCDISSSKRIGGMTERQLKMLLERLAAAESH